MSDPVRLRPISMILIMIAFSVAAVLSSFFFRQSDPPVVLWGDHGDENRYRRIHETLNSTVIPQVSWSNVPFGEALDELESWVHDSNPSAEEIRIDIDERVPTDTSISLRLKNVPATEVLRYLSVLNEAKYQIHGEGRIDIVPVSAPDSTREGWFSVNPDFFHGIDPAKPEEIRSMFVSMGIEIADSEKIEYFPDRDLLQVYSSRDNLDLIESYLASSSVTRHDWVVRLNEWWYQTRIKIHLIPPPLPPRPPPPPSTFPDSFGSVRH